MPQSRAVILALLLTTTLVNAAPPDAKQRIEKLIPSTTVKVIPPGEWKITEKLLLPYLSDNPASQPSTRSIKTNAGFDFAGHILLEDAASGHWYLGESPAKPQEMTYTHDFRELQEFIDAETFVPLPRPPQGFALRQLAAMPETCTRITSDGKGEWLLVEAANGNVYRIDLKTNQLEQVLRFQDYADKGGDFFGMGMDRDTRLYLIGNRGDHDARPRMNVVTVYRTDPAPTGRPGKPKPWLTQNIPWAIDVFQHGVSDIKQGPDGMIYISSGSRTDHGEAGHDPTLSKEGETPLTSCIWQLDPRSDSPHITVFARGLRNAFGFCFDPADNMFATENGPNAEPPEEINLIQQGKHYGFPFVFSDWTSKAYPDQPDPPKDFQSVLPIQNIGPAAGGERKPLSTLDPHSSPSGIVYLDNNFPTGYRNTFLVARFGNLIGLTKDVGFDILQVKLLDPQNGRLRAEVHPFLSPIARPTDLHLTRTGKIYINEHSRQIHNRPWELPGRILEVSVVTEPQSP